MGVEIERKFLIQTHRFTRPSHGTRMAQGYLSLDPDRTVRVRLAGNDGTLTIKGRTRGAERLEFEFSIPGPDAAQLLNLCAGPIIDKTRYRVPDGTHVWEVDEFHGDNAGLWVAEIELQRADETFARPDWLGEEVTSDPRYYNARLAQHPYKDW